MLFNLEGLDSILPAIIAVGESELVVFLVPPGGEWVEVHRQPIRVLSTLGFEVARLSPVVTLTADTQVDSDTFPDEERDGPRRR